MCARLELNRAVCARRWQAVDLTAQSKEIELMHTLLTDHHVKMPHPDAVRRLRRGN